MNLRAQEFDFDIIGRMKIYGLVSALVVLVSLVAIFTFGLNFGIDFAGGYEIQVTFAEQRTENEIRDALAAAKIEDARVQRFGAADANQFLILVREHGTITEQQKSDLKGAFEGLAGGADNVVNWAVAESGESLMVGFSAAVAEGQVRELLESKGFGVKSIQRGEREDRPEYSVELVSLADQIEKALREQMKISSDAPLVDRVEFVGPQVGAELRNQGILAIIYALAFILLYIAVRFDLFFSPGAVIALIHDVIITVGAFAILQLEFNLPIVAAILALVGYSLNDTIVVYDRIRENTARLRGRELRPMVNTSINQTLSRSLLTSGTTLLVVIALLVFGGAIIQDFAVALLIGITVGTYSSIGIASPVYILLREHYQKRPNSSDKNVVAAA